MIKGRLTIPPPQGGLAVYRSSFRLGIACLVIARLPAVVRDNTLDSEKLGQGGGNVAEFHSAHASQAGYRGSIIVDAGSGRQITLTLWRSEVRV